MLVSQTITDQQDSTIYGGNKNKFKQIYNDGLRKKVAE